MLKNKTRLGNNFHFKNRIPKDLTSGVVYKFYPGACNESYYDECIRHLNVRIGEHIGHHQSITKKQVKPKSTSIANHLLFYNHSISYDDISIAWEQVPIQYALVIRSFLEFYLFLIVAKLFLLNSQFFILPCVNVWTPLFALMVLLNLLSSWSWN